MAEQLSALAVDEGGVERRVRDHVAACLACQAEMVRYRRLGRTLHDLRAEHLSPPAADLRSVLDALDAADDPRPDRRLAVAAAVSGVAVTMATAAGAAGVLVWRRRRLDLSA